MEKKNPVLFFQPLFTKPDNLSGQSKQSYLQVVKRGGGIVGMRLSKISAPFEGHDITYFKMRHFRLYG